MKTKLFLLLTCIFCVSIYGQEIGWENHIISDNAVAANFVFTADIDGDGDKDVLSASPGDDKIAWYENMDGHGDFEEYIITTNAEGANTVRATYIDGDGYMDVVASSQGDDTIAWWKNVNGDGTDWEENVITTNADGVVYVICADIDGDGDMDVVAAYYNVNTVAWWENTDGQGTFVEHIITTSAMNARVVFVADLNNDDYPDVLSASLGDGRIAWYENTDGQGNFGPQQIIIEDPIGAWQVYAADIDGDDDMDVVASVGNDITAWCENYVGLGNFTVHEVFPPSWAEGFSAADIDGDGDLDLFTAENFPNEIGWYKNVDGLGGSFEWNLIQSGALAASTVCAEDIDGDGDMDVVSGWWGGDTVAWHENLRIDLGVDENTLSDFSVYPNPTTGILTVQSKTAIVQIEIHNLLGQLVLSIPMTIGTNHPPDGRAGNTIDISSVSQGIYFIKVMDENDDLATRKVVKK